MAGKAQIGPAGAPTGVEINDRVAAGIVEYQAMANEAEPFEPCRDDIQRALAALPPQASYKLSGEPTAESS